MSALAAQALIFQSGSHDEFLYHLKGGDTIPLAHKGLQILGCPAGTDEFSPHDAPKYVLSERLKATSFQAMSDSAYRVALAQLRLGIKQGGFGLIIQKLVAPAALLVATRQFQQWLTQMNFDLPWLLQTQPALMLPSTEL